NNQSPPTAEEAKLLDQAKLLADGDPRGLEAAPTLAQALKGRAGQPANLHVLGKLRQYCVDASTNREDEWLATAAVPLVAILDRQILDALPSLAKRLADPQEPTANRREAAGQLAAGLIALDKRPVRPPIKEPLRNLTAFPIPGSPANLALA